MGNGWSGDATVRRPGAVPDLPVGVDGGVDGGVDTDGDGVPDTVLVAEESDLLVQTDLDVDGVVDRVLRIGPDGAVRAESPDATGGSGPDDPVHGSVPAEWSGWPGWLDGLVDP